jgi:hypothetical protein
VEAIGDLIARGELPFSFMDAPVMAAQPRLTSTYEEFCAQHGIELFQQTLMAVYRRHRQHVWLDHRPPGRILEAKGLYQRLEAPPASVSSI